MKVLIVDDEKPARDRLRQLLEDFGNYEVVGEAGNGEDAEAPVIDDAAAPDPATTTKGKAKAKAATSNKGGIASKAGAAKAKAKGTARGLAGRSRRVNSNTSRAVARGRRTTMASATTDRTGMSVDSIPRM